MAQNFRQADEEYQKKQAEKTKETPKKKKKEEKSWWEKGLDEAAEFFGVNDAIRAVTGKDPITGKELSTKERLIAAGWTILNVIPVGKALLDGAKKVSSKLYEGVSFLALKAKGLSNKIGDLWNKGKTKVKNDFIEADKAFRYAMKKLGEYVPKFGEGLTPVMEGAGKIPSGGKSLLKDAYQYVKETGEKVFGSGEKNVGKESDRANKIDTTDESVTYYRVQGGGSGNKTSQYRVKVNEDGSISIPNKNADLNISAYDLEHAIYYRDVARPGGEIVEFKVPKELDDLVKETKVDQYGYSKNDKNQGGTAPKLVDPTTPDTSYELPAEPWIKWLEEYGHSARRIE
ncbi:pre-toxin TG domain-containing protein [Bacillus sp. SY8(2021)]|uniref:Pre-toxin TG domain-containing protein n=1 Tax=Bacillus arachidis TaxID=2819290 RepID=A0ABS3P5N0_9BACI|nr:pre-toxin TG domain-containing protein [Bacillus arachidis]